MTAPIPPGKRAAIRRHAVAGYSLSPSEVLRLLDTLVIAEAERDEARAALDTAEAEVARLREERCSHVKCPGGSLCCCYPSAPDVARPAPVWDEDTVTEAVVRALRARLPLTPEPALDATAYAQAHAALAVVREHLPIRPDREALSALLLTFLNPPKYKGASWTYSPDKAADAVLDLWG